MNKIIIAPDSFKGTMSSKEICDITAAEILAFNRDTEVISCQVADGGEGTIDSILSRTKGNKERVSVNNPYFEEIDTYYCVIDNGKTAVVETATVIGLPLLDTAKRNPKDTSSYGVGEQINSILERHPNVNEILIGLGGSSTNDAGCGMLSALGIKFLNGKGERFIPVGGTLDKIKSIDISELNPKLKNVDICAMCDINNPLYGKQGAAYVFAPQKGADKDSVKLLDDNLCYFASLTKTELGVDISGISGGGAAGGIGAGLVGFLNAKLTQGIELILNIMRFDELIENADLIITGEGRIDSQSCDGKAISGIIKRAKKNNIPVVALVGDIDGDLSDLYSLGLTAVLSINRLAIPYEKAKLRAKDDLKETVKTLMRLINYVT